MLIEAMGMAHVYVVAPSKQWTHLVLDHGPDDPARHHVGGEVVALVRTACAPAPHAGGGCRPQSALLCSRQSRTGARPTAPHLVISSPSRSTTGLATLILSAMAAVAAARTLRAGPAAPNRSCTHTSRLVSVDAALASDGFPQRTRRAAGSRIWWTTPPPAPTAANARRHSTNHDLQLKSAA
jgi:hypothetical protein